MRRGIRKARGIRRVLVFAEWVMPIQNGRGNSKWVGPGRNGSGHSERVGAYRMVYAFLDGSLDFLDGLCIPEIFRDPNLLPPSIGELGGDRVPTPTPPARPPREHMEIGAHKRGRLRGVSTRDCDPPICAQELGARDAPQFVTEQSTCKCPY